MSALPMLVLIRGIPGSGKSTMAKAIARVGYDHYEADMFFEASGFNPEKLPEAHQWCQGEVRLSLEHGIPCVVANTFTRRWELAPYLDMASEMGVTVKVIEAEGSWQNVHGVPDAVVQKMRERWEALA